MASHEREALYGNKGSIVAFLRPSKSVNKGERPHELGIMCRDLTVKAYIGTCLMEDGRLQTYKYLDLKKAHLRYQQLDQKYTMDGEKKELSAKLTALETESGFKRDISVSEAAFDALNVPRRRTKPPTSSKPVAQHTKVPLAKKSVMPGTLLAMWFLANEGNSSTEPTKSIGGWFCGVVKEIKQNQFLENVYTCEFDTPDKNEFYYDWKQLSQGIKNLLKLEALPDTDPEKPPFDLRWRHNELHGIQQPVIQTPGWRLLGNEGLGASKITNLFDTGALNLAVVLGVRLDLSCILKRNGIHHSQGIRHLTRYHIALIVKCLGSGLNAKNKRLRAEMLENGVTLAVRRLFLSNLQGTNAWGPDVSQELALVESFYNHNDFVATNHAAAARLVPSVCDVKKKKASPSSHEKKATVVAELQDQAQPTASHQSGDQNLRKGKNPFPDPFEWHGRKRVCVECVVFTTPNADAKKQPKDGPATDVEGLQHLAQPTASYQSGDQKLRKRIFPCPMCGDPADGSHQCGVCFKHVHAICGDPFPGSIEGHGQQRICLECLVYNKPNVDAANLRHEGPVKRPLSRSDLEAGWRFDEISRIGANFMGRDDRSPMLEPGDQFYDLQMQVHKFNPYDLVEYASLLTFMASSLECLDPTDHEEFSQTPKADDVLCTHDLKAKKRSKLNLTTNRLRKKKVHRPKKALPNDDHNDAAARSLLPPNLDMSIVPRDGNCMFHALARSVPATGLTHVLVRERIVEHVLNNWNDHTISYKVWICNTHKNETPETYKLRMLGRSKDWGDYPELVAAATIFQKNIAVLEYVEDATDLACTTIDAPGLTNDEPPSIFLIRVGLNHYHAGALQTCSVMKTVLCICNVLSFDFVVSGLTKAREDECGIQLHTTEKQTKEQVSEIERSEACGIAAYITGLQNEIHGKETGVCSTALLETVETKRERKRLRLQLRKEKRRKRSEAVASETIATLSTTTEAETNNAFSHAITKQKKTKRKKRKVDVDDTSEARGATSLPARNSTTSDSANETETKKAALITPDGLYEYLGEGLGFKKLSKKRKRGHIKRNTVSKKWATAMRRHWNSAKKDAAMAAITMKRCDMSTAFHRLQIDGVVIIDDFFDDNTSATSTSKARHSKPLFTCPPGQSTYISQAKRSRDVVYDGVVRSDRTAGYDTIHGKQDPKTKTKHIKGPVIRQQLKCCKSNQEEMKKYYSQMELILQNIFGKEEQDCKKDPQNWMYKMTNIIGGLEYQHAHADQGWGMEFEGEKLFPFVATHGFGEHPFSMWLLPRGKRGKNDYGYYHTIPRTGLLLMRGDFIHAGGVSWFPRCHMKFYPRASAGLVRNHTHHYWLSDSFQCDIDEPTSKHSQDERSYLWQHYAFPFAYPSFQHVLNKTSKVVEEIVRYYPEITLGLMDTSKEGRETARDKIRPKKLKITEI